MLKSRFQIKTVVQKKHTHFLRASKSVLQTSINLYLSVRRLLACPKIGRSRLRGIL